MQQAKDDPKSFVKLYDHYVDRLYAYPQREIKDTVAAQDIVEVTFEKVLKNLPHYQ